MKIFITGGAGYFGSLLTSSLIESRNEVTVFDRFLFGAESLLSFAPPYFRLIRGDILDLEALRNAMRGVEAVVHLAAIVGEPACLVNPKAAHAIHVRGTENVSIAAQDLGIDRLIFISTCSNYGVSDFDELTSENSPLRPLSQYAKDKVEAEEILASSSATIFRFGTLAGLSPRMRFDLLVNDLARLADLARPIEIFSPQAWRPFLHVRDAISAIAACLTAPKNRVQQQIFNVVTENCQKSDLIALVKKHYPHSLIQVTDKAPDRRDYRVSDAKIRSALRWSPSQSVERAFLEVAEAVKNRVFVDPMGGRYSAIPEYGSEG